MSWFLYVLRCSDETLYTGITTDPARRLREHNQGPRGARYTRARRPVELLASWVYEDRSSATRAEIAFKALNRREKLRRIEELESVAPGRDGRCETDLP